MTSPDQRSTQTASLSDNDANSAEDVLSKIHEEYAIEQEAAAETLASHIEQHKRREAELHETISLLKTESHDRQQFAEEDAAAKESSIEVLRTQVEELQCMESAARAVSFSKEEQFNATISELEAYVKSLEEEKRTLVEKVAAEKDEASKALAAQIALNSHVEKELQEALAVMDQEAKGLQWEEKCRSLKKSNGDLINEVAALKETIKKQRIDTLEFNNVKRKLELDFQAQRDGDAKTIKDLEKKINDKQMAKKKKEQDEWEATDRQMQVMDSSLEQARKAIRQECAQRIKELEDKLRDSDAQLNAFKTQLGTAQRELATSKRKAKKIQQGAQVTEKVILAPEPSTISPVDELKLRVNSMSASSWGIGIVLVVLVMRYLTG